MNGEFSGGSAGLPAPLDAARPRALPTTRQFFTKRGLLAALAAVVAPKCLLCLAGYLAVGGAAVELCGGAPDDHTAAWLLGGIAGVMLLVIGWRRSSKRKDGMSGRPHTVR